jgi:hypothetical protein
MKATKIIKGKGSPPSTSIALALHTSKGASRVSSLINLEGLGGRIPVKTMSSKSLGSLKDYCIRWNDADIMDTASSGNPKVPTKTQTLASSSSEIPAKPRVIASEFFKVQQNLFQIADATTVSPLLSLILSHISPQSPKMSSGRDMGIWDVK